MSGVSCFFLTQRSSSARNMSAPKHWSCPQTDNPGYVPVELSVQERFLVRCWWSALRSYQRPNQRSWLVSRARAPSTEAPVLVDYFRTAKPPAAACTGEAELAAFGRRKPPPFTLFNTAFRLRFWQADQRGLLYCCAAVPENSYVIITRSALAYSKSSAHLNNVNICFY